MRGNQRSVGVSDPARSELLGEVLREIVRIERSLSEAGDHQMLARYGDPENGAAIAALLGYALLATDEARIVDQLSYFPESTVLVRDYLARTGAPRTWEVAAAPVPEREPARQSQGGGLYTHRPATIVATTSASRSSQGS